MIRQRQQTSGIHPGQDSLPHGDRRGEDRAADLHLEYLVDGWSRNPPPEQTRTKVVVIAVPTASDPCGSTHIVLR